MSEPAYTLQTDKLGTFVIATYICESCNREQYGTLETSALIMAIGLVVFLAAFVIETEVLSNE